MVVSCLLFVVRDGCSSLVVGCCSLCSFLGLVFLVSCVLVVVGGCLVVDGCLFVARGLSVVVCCVCRLMFVLFVCFLLLFDVCDVQVRDVLYVACCLLSRACRFFCVVVYCMVFGVVYVLVFGFLFVV